MRKRTKRSVVAALGAALLMTAVPAPAQARVETDHCLEPPYTVQLIIYCGCVAAATVATAVLPDSQWYCRKP
jgi:hypothetical protein